MLRKLCAITIIVSVLSGCCPKVVLPPDTCIGKVESVDGLKETELFDKTLVGIAIGLPHEGKLCAGQEYVVTKPVVVYRVWDKSKVYSRSGTWWTFEKPQGPIEDWRSAYAVCREWGARDVVSRCQLKVGSKIVVGPGQSITCKEEIYPHSAANQVFIPNKLVNETDYVDQCEDHAWPYQDKR